MAEIVIYTKSWCPYCFRAKSLLDAREAAYREIDVEDDPTQEAEMVRLAGGRDAVPQIFIDGKHIGGSEELGRLHTSGELDRLLGSAG